ncbi:E3 ubiquitin-protein ligase RNF8-like isoform X1 [Amphibalanus amphitrite]|uniref:E3 ubiquitin-protein ligase RNF8-like isoform X1 n=1 Tax=Amphibalanus amphitrite TaxID=1232801 RepID=UPI001C90D1B2|nr:E3 ubiquitin-protein ligase RNF8-like isoform X1 [Amphibalanus amphitrite]
MNNDLPATFHPQALKQPSSDEEEQLNLALALSRSESETSAREALQQPSSDEEEQLNLALALSRSESENSSSAREPLSSRRQSGGRPPPAASVLEELSCPVCRETIDTATTLGCGHTFCAGCLSRAQACGGHQCPLCRKPIQFTVHCIVLDNVIRALSSAPS